MFRATTGPSKEPKGINEVRQHPNVSVRLNPTFTYVNIPIFTYIEVGKQKEKIKMFL